jgi:glycosyltransferase involved in cell wall biosynthesis
MRVLVLHSPYLSGTASGENRVVEDEVRLLRMAGHDVTALVPERRDPRGLDRAREGVFAVWSPPAVARVRQVLREGRVDVVHTHNLFPALSPAVLRAAAAEGIPVVATLHAYRLLCLPATFLRDCAVCEDCLGRLPWRGVVHRCYRGSLAASASLAASLSLHRRIGTFDRVTLFLAVSQFLRSKHLAAGFSAERVVVKPNFAWDTQQRAGPGEYFLFLGRLYSEKGVDILVEAWREVHARLLVVGDGPETSELRRVAPAGVEFKGQVPARDVPNILSSARALVLPSLSYEGSPRSLLEAFAAGVPVLVSSMGALPEHVQPEVSGLVVPPDDPAALASAIERLTDDKESERMGKGARRAWQERFSPERNLQALEAAYKQALGGPRESARM